jgi:hypothetical protein
MATRRLITTNDLLNGLTQEDLEAWVRERHQEPVGGCDACLFEDPFSDRLCTIPDISAEDFDLGVSGINCSRFQPRRRPKPTTKSERSRSRDSARLAEQEAARE